MFTLNSEADTIFRKLFVGVKFPTEDKEIDKV